MRKFKVLVSPAEGGKRPTQFIVSATTEDDAIQLAFALDGGWNRNEMDASEILELAKCYCEVAIEYDPARLGLKGENEH